MNELVPSSVLGLGTLDPSFMYCEYLWCQVVPEKIRFLEAAFREINTENYDPFCSLSAKDQAMNPSLESLLLEPPLALNQCVYWDILLGHKDIFSFC